MKIILKCNGKKTPWAVAPEDVSFTAETSDGICDKFIFRLTNKEKIVYEKSFSDGFFSVLRLREILSENENYHAEIQAFYKGNLVGNDSVDFFTAFLPQKAEWVGFDKDSDYLLKFKKCFYVLQKKEVYRLFICGLGFYDVYINGARLDGYFKPVVSDYCEREIPSNPLIFKSHGYKTFADVYEITDLIREGENEIIATVGDGYFRNLDKSSEPFVSYGEKRLIFEVVEEKDVVAYSDKYTLVKELRHKSSLFIGDRLDFSESEGKYKNVRVLPSLKTEFGFSAMGRDEVFKVLFPKRTYDADNCKIYDFGFNHSGCLAFKVKGKKGCTLTVRYAEILRDDGSLNTATSAWCDTDKNGGYHEILQTSSFILSGNYDEIVPFFSWRCYRYVSIECECEYEIKDFKSLFIVGDLEQNATFESSDETLNEIFEKGILTIRDNVRSGIITDCPHREKRAYTGDGQIIAQSVLYSFDGVRLYDKWLNDIINAQRDDGFVPYTVPCINGGGGYAWSNAIAVVPTELYRITGDTSYIERSLPFIEKWIAFLEKQVKSERSFLKDEWLLGDWLAPGVTDFCVPYMNALCLYSAISSALFFAAELNYSEKTDYLKNKLGELKDYINERWFDSESVRYSKGIQGENVLPVLYEIVPDEYKEKLLLNLKESYEKNGFHFDTGIVVTPYLIDCLCENEMSDTAFRLLTAKDYPSYAFMLKGESTLSEHWSKKWPDYKTGKGDEIIKGGGDLSHCHPMFASVISRLFKYAAGLDLSELYKGEIIIKPSFISQLNYAKAEKQTIFGTVSLFWEKNEDGVCNLKISLPCGIKGRVKLPNAKEITLNHKSEIVCRNGEFSVFENAVISFKIKN